MHFTIKNEFFFKKLISLVGVVERKSNLPILSNILLELDERLSLTVSDLEIEIQTYAPILEVKEKGTLTVSMRKLYEICRSLSGEAILDFQLTDQFLSIKSNKSRFKLAILPHQEFPKTVNDHLTPLFSLSGKEMSHLLNSCYFAIADQDVRFYLHGMFWQLTQGILRVVATDGHRLATTECLLRDKGTETASFIVPKKAIMELRKILSDYPDEMFHVKQSSHLLLIETQDLKFFTKLIDAAYPDFQRSLPKQKGEPISIKTNDLKESIVCVTTLSNEKNRVIRFAFKENALLLTSQNNEYESAEYELPLFYTGVPFSGLYLSEYILDVLQHIGSDEVVLSFPTGERPAMLITSEKEPALMHLIMPRKM